MPNAVFITATDTDAGKTWVTQYLIRALLKQRENAKAIKPIACGLDDHGENAKAENTDVRILRDAQGLSQASDINYCSFNKAAAPSIAAQAEGKSINPEHLKSWCREQVSSVDVCLIEAIGGLMTPITANYLVSDWLRGIPDMPVILVVGAKLGCINHALLSLSQLASIGRDPAWVVINNRDGTQDTHAIKEALLPHLSSTSSILECGYNQPENLSPLVVCLQGLLHNNI
ncbi:dethiobiotin synthase [Mariprofundus ferrooxydans]|nr:dethiobiotin synthase [Mariprofundus ferrooxydans]